VRSPRDNLAAINAADGTATPWAPYVDSDVNAIAATASTVYIGGYFSTVGADPHSFIAAVNASDGTPVTGWNGDSQSYVQALARSGSKLFVGGYFNQPQRRESLLHRRPRRGDRRPRHDMGAGFGRVRRRARGGQRCRIRGRRVHLHRGSNPAATSPLSIR